jgi:putative copper resistance protein D
MHALYLISVWLHLLAAIVWIGGMAFLVLVVVPWLRKQGGATDAGRFLRETGERFRNVGWICFAIIALTGTFNLSVRGVRLADLFSSAWRSSAFGKIVLFKLGAFSAVLLVSALHDFVLGPRATRAMMRDPRSAEAQAMRRKASWIARANVLFALALVAAGVMLVRGALW